MKKPKRHSGTKTLTKLLIGLAAQQTPEAPPVDNPKINTFPIIPERSEGTKRRKTRPSTGKTSSRVKKVGKPK